MKQLFEGQNSKKENQNFLYEARHPEEILYAIFILKDNLERLTLTASQMMASYEELRFGIVNDQLLVNGEKLEKGKHTIEDITLFVLPAYDLHTHFLILDDREFVIHNSDKHRAIQTKDASLIIIDQEQDHSVKALIKPLGDFVYYNDDRVQSSTIREVKVGDSILTPDFILERRPEQWKITTFSKEIIFNSDFFLEQKRKLEKPQDFPEYRRSPRLNLEIPDEVFKYEKNRE